MFKRETKKFTAWESRGDKYEGRAKRNGEEAEVAELCPKKKKKKNIASHHYTGNHSQSPVQSLIFLNVSSVDIINLCLESWNFLIKLRSHFTSSNETWNFQRSPPLSIRLIVFRIKWFSVTLITNSGPWLLFRAYLSPSHRTRVALHFVDT